MQSLSTLSARSADDPFLGHLAAVLNSESRCVGVDGDRLRRALEADLGDSALVSRLLASRPHLLATSPVFVTGQQVARMHDIVRAVEEVVANEAYRRQAEDWAPAIARQELGSRGVFHGSRGVFHGSRGVFHGSRGVFYGYDFHLGPNGPRLIEINTNAGGALLNLYLARAQRACCAEMTDLVGGSLGGGTLDADGFEERLVAMFRNERWLEREDRLRSIAIADENPAGQFLHPELLLFQRLFERHGIKALVADPRHFTLRDGSLWLGDRQIDLVYNRLTDFYLEADENAALRRAYTTHAATVTPGPRSHALYASKRNLTLLSDRDRLVDWGVDPEIAGILQRGVPRSVRVSRDNGDELWSERKRLFFKPVAGYGSRGAYRGAKLTRKVWRSILDADYVAQEVIPPSERRVVVDGVDRALKLDVRAYVYDGAVQLLAARLYQGQTTNLRTAGGGLATVFTVRQPLETCRTFPLC